MVSGPPCYVLPFLIVSRIRPGVMGSFLSRALRRMPRMCHGRGHGPDRRFSQTLRPIGTKWMRNLHDEGFDRGNIHACLDLVVMEVTVQYLSLIAEPEFFGEGYA